MKHCVLIEKQDEILNKDKRMDNVEKHNICTNLILFDFVSGLLLLSSPRKPVRNYYYIIITQML
jgi:hypothetical protein